MRGPARQLPNAFKWPPATARAAERANGGGRYLQKPAACTSVRKFAQLAVSSLETAVMHGACSAIMANPT
jgi:hypothetical protein